MLTSSDISKLADAFSKDHLLQNHLPLVRRFCKSNFFTVDMLSIPLVSSAIGLLATKKSYNKQELGVICFVIFYDQSIFQAFIRSMPEWLNSLLEKLLWQKEMHRNEVEKIVGQQIVDVSKDGVGYDYLPELKFFSIRAIGGYYFGRSNTWDQDYAKNPVAFALPMPLKLAISPFYPKPEGYDLKPIDVLDEVEKRNIFNAEADILQEFSPLISYYLQDNIKFSEKGRPNVGGLKKIQRTLALKEFYDDKDAALYPVRTMLVLGMLYNFKQKDVTNDTPSIIKKLFTNHFTASKHPTAMANFIINQVKGIGYLNEYDFSSEAAPIFWNLMKEMPTKGWITWNNIETYLQTHFLEPQPIYSYGLNKLYFEDGDKDRAYIDDNNRTQILQWAFVKGCIFLLAAYGMVEIAYTKPDTTELGKTWFNEYDGLQALRLTGLGKFVLDKSNSYEPPINENAAKLIFDEENLIIRAEGNLNLMSTLLGNYVEKISANRFAFRPILFLKDCKNLKQIENKIALFRKSLNVKLPAFWELELKQMVNNASAVAQQSDFFVFKINETDKQLLRTIAQDNQLKALAIKAERFYVLVDKKNKAAFKNRLMELGYFVEA